MRRTHRQMPLPADLCMTPESNPCREIDRIDRRLHRSDRQDTRLAMVGAIMPDQTLQSADETFDFLLEIADLPARRRAVFDHWLVGHSLSETARALGITAQAAQRHVREALRTLYDVAPVSFAAVSRRPVYRPPHKPSGVLESRVCRRCGYLFRAGQGDGPYCGADCRRAPGRSAANDRAARKP